MLGRCKVYNDLGTLFSIPPPEHIAEMSTNTNSSPPPDSLIDAEKAIQYWNEVPTSLAGIMGGFPQASVQFDTFVGQ